MAPRLSGQTSIFGVVFFVSKSLLGIEGQKKLENFAILTQRPQSHAWILMLFIEHGLLAIILLMVVTVVIIVQIEFMLCPCGVDMNCSFGAFDISDIDKNCPRKNNQSFVLSCICWVTDYVRREGGLQYPLWWHPVKESLTWAIKPMSGSWVKHGDWKKCRPLIRVRSFHFWASTVFTWLNGSVCTVFHFFIQMQRLFEGSVYMKAVFI